MRERVVHVHEHPDAALDLGEFGDDWKILLDRQPAAAMLPRHEQAERAHVNERRHERAERELLAILDLALQRIELGPDAREYRGPQSLVLLLFHARLLRQLTMPPSRAARRATGPGHPG